MNKEMLFTVGQFAKLHNINKRTLQYYDDIELFSPSIVADNGYRKYSYLQSPTLEMILTFRELGMSLEEIKEYRQNTDIELFCCIANRKIDELSKKISHLSEIRSLLENKVNTFEAMKEINLSSVQIIDLEEEKMLVSEEINGSYDWKDFDILVKHMQAQDRHNIFALSFGSMIKVEKITNNDYEKYHCFFTKVKSPNDRYNFVKPKGKYIRAFSEGSWDNLKLAYTKIIEFAKLNNLNLIGYAYEEGINEMAVSSINEYITQIDVKCVQK